MNIRQETIAGLVPVTEKELRYMANRNTDYDLTKLDTSRIIDMCYVFNGTERFNQDIGNWDTSNVTNMGAMFAHAFIFNQDISKWDTSNVINMDSMFSDARTFNQDLSGWNVGNIRYYLDFADGADDYTLPKPKFNAVTSHYGTTLKGSHSMWGFKTNIGK